MDKQWAFNSVLLLLVLKVYYYELSQVYSQWEDGGGPEKDQKLI